MAVSAELTRLFLMAICGGAFALLIGWLIGRRQFKALKLRHDEAREQLIRLTTQSHDLAARLAEARGELIESKTQLDEERALSRQHELIATELRTRLTEMTKQVTDRQSFQEETRVHMLNAFKSLSSDVLDVSNQRFLELANQKFAQLHRQSKSELDLRAQKIEALVKPLNDSLKTAQQQIHELEKSRADAFGRISETMANLQQETVQLSRALRTPQARGRWGEMQLRRVVELAGMVPYCDFTEQTTSERQDSQKRPDLIVKLPDSRQLIIDAKAPLSAFLESMDAKDAKDRTLKLQQHAAQFQNHIKQLAGKKYWDEFAQAPDFVILFVPGDHFLSAALEVKPDLIETAATQRVLLATPSTLIALLKAVAYGWNQEKMAQSAREVVELGKELQDRLLTFAGHLEGIGKGLSGAVKSFNAGARSFESRLMVSARKFQDLGVESDKAAPNLTQIAMPSNERLTTDPES